MIQYWITIHVEGMDFPMFRVNYSSKYYTGSYPINNKEEAEEFIKREFGTTKLPYGLETLKAEVSEIIKKACKELKFK